VLGYEGKWAIHPSQIPLANEVFTPDDHLVEKTHRIIAAMKQAAAEGKGAVSLDGRLIDAASIRMAETLLAKLEQIEEREQNGNPPPEELADAEQNGKMPLQTVAERQPPRACSTNARTSCDSSPARVTATSSELGARLTGR